MIKSLKGGESFGELALLMDEYRTATAISLENTHLAVLSKYVYD